MGLDWTPWVGLPAATAAPGNVLFQEGLGKGWHKGWFEGHSAGFGKGYHTAALDFTGGKGKGAGKRKPEAEEEEEEESAAGKKKKKKKKGGSSWKEWQEKYTTFDPDKDDITPYFYTRLGPSKCAVYPQEIQEELLRMTDDAHEEEVSQDIKYDMT